MVQDSVIRGPFADSESVSSPFGKVYTPRELAELWQFSENSLQPLFQDEPGTFTLGSSNPRGRRGHSTLRIPEAVALRVWRSAGPGSLDRGLSAAARRAGGLG
jgi:hypothetical protein